MNKLITLINPSQWHLEVCGRSNTLYEAASEHYVPEADVLEEVKIGKRKDLSVIVIVVARRPTKSVPSKENWWTGQLSHEGQKLIYTHGEQ